MLNQQPTCSRHVGQLMATFYGVGACLLVLSWTAWIAAGLLLHLLLPWRRCLPPAFSEMLTYGKLKNGGAVPATSAGSSPPHELPRISRGTISSCGIASVLMQRLNSVPRR